jgi:FMN reductase (NADPH)/FMN reductase [NAD(P)H]
VRVKSFDEVFSERRSVRRYTSRRISGKLKSWVLDAAMRAPTAGNLMLYSVIEIEDQAIKQRLSVTCDNQPFIADAPWVLVFLADYQRMMDCFAFAGTSAEQREVERPREADLLLACCDALIAAQTAVIAAEACGLGSCYIGDIMENYETHRDLMNLPRCTFPVAMVCFGFPTAQQSRRRRPTRFPRRIIVHRNVYRSITRADMEEMYPPGSDGEDIPAGCGAHPDAAHQVRALYERKFASAFAAEMRRSVSAMLENWR